MIKPTYPLAIFLLVLGLIAAVYSWPIFLLVLLAILAVVLAWLYLPFILMILPALTPFLPALNPTADIDLASVRLIIALLAVVGSIYIVYTKKSWFVLSTPTILILFFLFWSVFSGLMAEDSGRYLRKVLVYLTIFPVYFLALTFLRQKSKWEKLFKYWSWSAFLVSLIGLGQFLFQFIGGRESFLKIWGKLATPILFGVNSGEAVASNPSWLVGTGGGDLLRAISVFPDPHMLAFFLGMSIPLQVAYIVNYSMLSFSGPAPYGAGRANPELVEGKVWESRKNFALWALPALSFLVLLLTFSRGSYVGLAGVVLWLIYYLWRQKKIHITSRKIFYLFLIIFASVWATFSVAPVRERFLSILDFNEGSNIGRLEIWGEALSVAAYNPVFGVGLGNYSNFVRPESKYREPIYAHNTYLDIASEIGIPGMIAWALLLIWAINPLLLARRSFSVGGREAAFAKGGEWGVSNYNLAASLGILWFSLHCLFETPIFSPQILPLLLFLLAFRAYYAVLSPKS